MSPIRDDALSLPDTSIRLDFCGCGLYVQLFYSVVTRISVLTFESYLRSCPAFFLSFSECQGLRHGFWSAVASHAISLTVGHVLINPN